MPLCFCLSTTLFSFSSLAGLQVDSGEEGPRTRLLTPLARTPVAPNPTPSHWGLNTAWLGLQVSNLGTSTADGRTSLLAASELFSFDFSDDFRPCSGSTGISSMTHCAQRKDVQRRFQKQYQEVLLLTENIPLAQVTAERQQSLVIRWLLGQE